MHAFVVLGFVFPYQAKKLAWATLPKWPILYWVGRKNLNSISSVCVNCGCGLVILWRQCSTLYTSFKVSWKFLWQLHTIFSYTSAGERINFGWSYNTKIVWVFFLRITSVVSSPARVVLWLDHLDAMCTRACCALYAVGSRFNSSRGPGKARPPT